MRFIRKSAVNIGGTVVVTGLNFVVGVVLARTLSPTGLGQYSVVISATSVLSALFGVSIGHAAVFYRKRGVWSRSAATTVTLFACGVLGFLMACALGPLLTIESYFGPLPLLAIVAATAYGAALLATTNGTQMLLADMLIERHVLVRVVPFAAFVLLLLGWAATRTVTVTAALVFFGASQLLGLAVLIWLLRRSIDRRALPSKDEVGAALRYGGVLNLGYVLFLLNAETGILLTNQLATFDEVAYYKIALRLASLLLLIATSISPLLFVRWSGLEESERLRESQLTSRVFWALALAGAAFLGVVAAWLIPVFYGDEYRPAIAMLRVILIGIGARFVQTPVTTMFTSSGRPALLSVVLAVNLVLMVVLMLILVPVNQGMGAAQAFGFSSLLSLIFAYYLAASRYGFRPLGSLLLTRGDFHALLESLRKGEQG